MVIDLRQEHFITLDETNVSLAASTSTLTGIPTNCFRIISVEPRDLSSTSPGFGMEFVARDWNHVDMANARKRPARSPQNATVYFTIFGKGPPVDTLSVRVAPQITSAVNLTLAYVPTHGVTLASDANPIPGESDKAIEAWIVAHARAKEREDGSPDPDMLAIYANEKKNTQIALTPRQEQDVQTVEGMFEGMYD